MYHYNYKITNISTGEFYIGVRSCKCSRRRFLYGFKFYMEQDLC